MLNWMLKKTRDPVVETSVEKLDSLRETDKVFIVFYGDLSSAEGEIVRSLAVQDDYNQYYFIPESQKVSGSAEIFRPFADSISYEKVDEGLKAWISANERPVVVDFDDRTIGEIFSNKKNAVLLFDAQGSESLLTAFSAAAQIWKSKEDASLLFSHITKSNEHLNGLASYIKTSPAKAPVVFIDGAARTKSVLIENPASISSESIIEFLQGTAAKSGKVYKIDEEVVYP